MKISAFYNLEHIGDILLIRHKDGQVDHWDKKGDLCILYDESHQVLGYNVFQASHYFSHLTTGLISLKQPFEKEFQDLLVSQGMEKVEIEPTTDFKVGRILSVEEHPDSNHLHICQVDVLDEQLSIVCGAKNVEPGILVVVAQIGCVMPNGQEIESSSLRGIESQGMICSSRELNLKKNLLPKGNILILDSQQYHVGDVFDIIEEGK